MPEVISAAQLGAHLRVLVKKDIAEPVSYLSQLNIIPKRDEMLLVRPSLEDVLILLEHFPVYTLGTGSTVDFLKFDPQKSEFEIHRIERGGEVTYHCPQQLVGYPILNLRYYQQDLHWYLRQLEEVIILYQ